MTLPELSSDSGMRLSLLLNDHKISNYPRCSVLRWSHRGHWKSYFGPPLTYRTFKQRLQDGIPLRGKVPVKSPPVRRTSFLSSGEMHFLFSLEWIVSKRCSWQSPRREAPCLTWKLFTFGLLLAKQERGGGVCFYQAPSYDHFSSPPRIFSCLPPLPLLPRRKIFFCGTSCWGLRITKFSPSHDLCSLTGATEDLILNFPPPLLL